MKSGGATRKKRETDQEDRARLKKTARQDRALALSELRGISKASDSEFARIAAAKQLLSSAELYDPVRGDGAQDPSASTPVVIHNYLQILSSNALGQAILRAVADDFSKPAIEYIEQSTPPPTPITDPEEDIE